MGTGSRRGGGGVAQKLVWVLLTVRTMMTLPQLGARSFAFSIRQRGSSSTGNRALYYTTSCLPRISTAPFPTSLVRPSRISCRNLSSSTSSDNDDENDNGKQKRIVFLGTPDIAATTLQSIYEASQQPESIYKVVGVVTQPPKRRRRKGKIEPSPVGKLADALDLLTLCPETAKDPDFLQQLQDDLRPDLCITAAYGQYLPKIFLETPPLGTINIHPSLLPRWRGASPVQRSLQAGENPVGVTVLYTVSKMDAGPIICQKEQVIDENDTATTVLPLLFELGTDMLLDVLPDILQGRITMETATPQDESFATAATMIHASEAEFQVWQESALTCHNRLRGFSLWPQAYMYFAIGDRPDPPLKVKILQTRVVKDLQMEPTNVVQLGPTKKGLYVVCGDGSVLELLQVQPATRKAFPARDFQNGYPGETIRWVKTPSTEDKKDGSS